jgi:hypothetical protein
MNKALLVMAAGLGSRYGGVKQIVPVGPDGEILMEYAIYDALRAGFDRIVIVIKPEMLDDCRARFGDRISRAGGVPVEYAFQRTGGDWEGIPISAARTRPLGTVQAVLAARALLDRPFAVINADDYYGAEAMQVVSGALGELTGAETGAMVGYRLVNTVSPHGSVTRGVCSGEDGWLSKITETYRIRLCPDGSIRDESAGRLLAPDTLVSMNLWAFHPAILGRFNDEFRAFLRALPADDDRSECLLPVVMDRLVAERFTRVRVLRTEGRWFGLTYQEDRPGVVAALRQMHESGVYPPTLWEMPAPDA